MRNKNIFPVSKPMHIHVLFVLNGTVSKKIVLLSIHQYEPRHLISNNVVCAISKASDQPVHTLSLIRAFASYYLTVKLPALTEHQLGL